MRYSAYFQKIRVLYAFFFGNFCHVCESYKSKFEIHHIDSDTANDSPKNLLYCCSDCHKLIHQTNARVINKFYNLHKKRINKIHSRLREISQ